MFDTDSLGTMAEVGLGLAGFSGIAILLTRGGAQLARFEAHRLGIMLGTTLGGTFLALLPLVLLNLQVSELASGRVAAGLMAVFSAGFIAYFVTAIRHMQLDVPELVSTSAVTLVLLGHSTNLLVQLFSAVLAPARAPGLYLAGVLWLLMHGAYQFGRILFIRPREAPAAEQARPEPTTAPPQPPFPAPAMPPAPGPLPPPGASR